MPWVEPSEQLSLFPTGPLHDVNYLFTNVFSGEVLAELPLTGVQFSLMLNQPGPFQATLNVEDPLVQTVNWIDATIPMKTNVWVNIDGQLAYGGLLTNRVFTQGSPQVQLQGQDFLGYLTQRLQAQDYSENWYSPPGGSCGDIAHQVISDALAVPSSLPISIVPAAEAPEGYWITLTAPITQRQTVASIVSQLTMMSYLVGIDYACDPVYVNGVPAAQITLSYPRRGRPAGQSGIVLDTSYAVGQNGFAFSEDGTQMADGVVEMLAATGGVSGEQQAAVAFDDGFPLVEQVMTHAAFSPAALPDTVTQAFANADLAMYAYPVIVPTVTMPLFDDTGSGGYPSWGHWMIGDDGLLVVPQTDGPGPPANPRFPNGLEYYYRIVRADVTIADQGVSTVQFTMNIPPATAPPAPPDGSR